MLRRLLPLAVLLLAGCGPANKPADEKPDGTKPPSGTPGTAATGATQQVKKTLTREELKAWLKPARVTAVNYEARTRATVKAEFGPPDSSREVRRTAPDVRNSLVVTWTMFTYKGLTVDAAGSGKVDAETHIYFQIGPPDYVYQELTEFVP